MSDATFLVDVNGRHYEVVWPADPDRESGHDLWMALVYTADRAFVGYPSPLEGGFTTSDQVIAAARAYLTDLATRAARFRADIWGVITYLRAAIARLTEEPHRHDGTLGDQVLPRRLPLRAAAGHWCASGRPLRPRPRREERAHACPGWGHGMISDCECEGE